MSRKERTSSARPDITLPQPEKVAPPRRQFGRAGRHRGRVRQSDRLAPSGPVSANDLSALAVGTMLVMSTSSWRTTRTASYGMSGVCTHAGCLLGDSGRGTSRPASVAMPRFRLRRRRQRDARPGAGVAAALSGDHRGRRQHHRRRQPAGRGRHAHASRLAAARLPRIWKGGVTLTPPTFGVVAPVVPVRLRRSGTAAGRFASAELAVLNALAAAAPQPGVRRMGGRVVGSGVIAACRCGSGGPTAAPCASGGDRLPSRRRCRCRRRATPCHA